jgi:hypothetical protein
VAGFAAPSTPITSSDGTHALAVGALSVCLIVALTALSIKVTMAMPLLF